MNKVYIDNWQSSGKTDTLVYHFYMGKMEENITSTEFLKIERCASRKARGGVENDVHL